MRIVGCFLVLSVAWQVNGLVRNANKFRPFMARPESSDNIDEYYVDQPFDHYADDSSESSSESSDTSYESDESTWVQRGWSNNEFFENKDGPIFLMVGSEGRSDPSWLKKGAMYDLAKKYKAQMHLLEHRYYGSSQPFEDLSTEHMIYLTTDQAVGDIVNFIITVNEENQWKNKWILFGGRFAGNLAAWARRDQTELITGAVASSPPLEAKADFSEYNKVMKESLNTLYPGCGDAVTDASKKILEMFRGDGTDEVLKTFNICSEGFDHEDELDIAAFFDDIATDIREPVEANDDEDAVFKISGVCEKYMLNATIGTPLQRLAALAKSTDDGSECSTVSYNNDIEYLKTQEAANNGEWQWMYQSCNELGYFKTSASTDSLFGDSITLRYFTEQCVDLFGDKFNQNYLLDAVDEFNGDWKGTDIVTTNVVFVQGSIDPWHPLGMVKKPTEKDPLLFINGTSNIADMYSARSTDSPALKAARETIDSKIKEWLGA